VSIPAAPGDRRPARAIVDSHVHFWDPERLDYPWLDSLPRVRRAFDPADLDRDALGLPLGGLVFVECNCRGEQALQEARMVAEMAVREPRILAIVAFADLMSPEQLPPLLDAYVSLPLVRGIRHNIQGNPPGFCLHDHFIQGVREVGRRGFTFDLCATADQLPDVVELAARCPETALVLDHCGKPRIGARALDPWRLHIRNLAALPNVHCKLSGLLTESGPAGWSEEELVPYAEQVADAFGPDRLMYGGDWPVLTLAGTYREWYQFTRRFTEDWEPARQAAFYRENALRFYGIRAGKADGRG
jgi:L-fuconolactonase